MGTKQLVEVRPATDIVALTIAPATSSNSDPDDPSRDGQFGQPQDVAAP
jgi:hypothetical protein